jgi:hypothetical protein
MDEHDDDLEPKVYEDGEKEVAGYPNTGDELDDGDADPPGEEHDEAPLDDDPAEL